MICDCLVRGILEDTNKLFIGLTIQNFVVETWWLKLCIVISSADINSKIYDIDRMRSLNNRTEFIICQQ